MLHVAYYTLLSSFLPTCSHREEAADPTSELRRMGVLRDSPRQEHALPEQESTSASSDVVVTLGKFTAISAFLGMLWTAGYFATLPSGIPDLEKVPVTTLTSLVAIAGIWFLGLSVTLYGYSGAVYLAFAQHGKNVLKSLGRKRSVLELVTKRENEIPNNGRHKAALFWLYGGLILGSVLCTFTGDRIGPWTLLFIPVPALVMNYGIFSIRAKLGYKNWFEQYGRPAVAAAFVWYVTTGVADMMSHQMAVAEQSPVSPAETNFWPIFVAVLLTAAIISTVTAMGYLRLMPSVLVIAMLSIVYIAPHYIVEAPFRRFRLADYNTRLIIAAKQLQKMEDMHRRCELILRTDQPDEFQLHVISAVGPDYVAYCKSGNVWIRVPKSIAFAERPAFVTTK